MDEIQNLSLTIVNSNRIAGILLVTSFLTLLTALIIMIASGAISAFPAILQGSLAPMGLYISIYRMDNFLYAIGWVLQILGFTLLTKSLIETGSYIIALPAFIMILVAGILGILEASFHMSVTTWAIHQTVETDSEPEFYPALRQWAGTFQLIYLFLGLVALVGFGGALLKIHLVPTWISITSLVWGVAWLVALLFGVGIPAVLFIMPTVIGAALILAK
jgi:hypothetical protein